MSHYSSASFWSNILSYASDKTKILYLINHLLVIFAFFLPWNDDGRRAAFFSILLLFAIFYRNFRETLTHALKNRVVRLLLLLYLVYAVWLLGTTDMSMGLWYLKNAQIYLFPLLLYSLTQYPFLPRIFSAFFLGMVLNELTSYGIFFGILPASLSFYNTALDPTPAHYSHLAYGYALSFTLGMILYHLTASRVASLWQRAVLTIFFTTASINIFITGGRIGYLLYAIAIGTVLFNIYRKSFAKLLLLLPVSLLLIYSLAYHFSPIVKQKTEQTLITIEQLNNQNYNSSFGTRVAIWILGVDVIKEHFLFGTGTGEHMNSLQIVAQTEKPEFLKYVGTVGTNMHNSYFEVFMQLGLIGFLVYLSIFYQIFRYDQPNVELKTIQYLLVFLSLVYAIVNILSRNIPGVLFVSMLSFSMIKPTAGMLSLPRITVKSLALYVLAALSLFIIGIYS